MSTPTVEIIERIKQLTANQAEIDTLMQCSKELQAFLQPGDDILFEALLNSWMNKLNHKFNEQKALIEEGQKVAQ